MSKLNGDRSRHNRIRKSRIHTRARMRNLRKELAAKTPQAETKPTPAAA